MDLKTQLETVAKNIKLQSKTSKLSLTDSLTSNLVDLLDLFQAILNQTHEVAKLTTTASSYDSECRIHKKCDDEDDEPTPQPKTQPTKTVKETPLPKPYKPKILYPQRLRKEKIEAQYGKFLDMIRAI
ncbi:hypothetical protein Tco_0974649 [Tanacetum coccineum]|uniref:Uncharacterized protein n=1 Tax=Tanacetum coccineum TaxID=301880 RepID=A0ABQ5EDA4_9ASTR